MTTSLQNVLLCTMPVSPQDMVEFGDHKLPSMERFVLALWDVDEEEAKQSYQLYDPMSQSISKRYHPAHSMCSCFSSCNLSASSPMLFPEPLQLWGKYTHSA